ncbi:MAG: HNH endonuclease [Actinomycetota bacterium]
MQHRVIKLNRVRSPSSTHIYVTQFKNSDFFPLDSYGGKDASVSGKTFTVITDQNDKFETDIDIKPILRNRSGCGKFLQGRFRLGDSIHFYKIKDRLYYMSKEEKTEEEIIKDYKKTINVLDIRFDKKIKPLFSDEQNACSNEEKIKVRMASLIRDAKQVDLLFRELLSESFLPIKKEVTTTSYKRDVRFPWILKEKYNYTCQVCGINIKLPNNKKYIESHHIIPLSEGGKDTLLNMISVCPNCHKKFHLEAIKWDFDRQILIDNVNNILLNLKINHHL